MYSEKLPSITLNFGGLLYVIRIACFLLIFSVSPARYFAFYEKKHAILSAFHPNFIDWAVGHAYGTF